MFLLDDFNDNVKHFSFPQVFNLLLDRIGLCGLDGETIGSLWKDLLQESEFGKAFTTWTREEQRGFERKVWEELKKIPLLVNFPVELASDEEFDGFDGASGSVVVASSDHLLCISLGLATFDGLTEPYKFVLSIVAKSRKTGVLTTTIRDKLRKRITKDKFLAANYSYILEVLLERGIVSKTAVYVKTVRQFRIRLTRFSEQGETSLSEVTHTDYESKRRVVLEQIYEFLQECKEKLGLDCVPFRDCCNNVRDVPDHRLKRQLRLQIANDWENGVSNVESFYAYLRRPTSKTEIDEDGEKQQALKLPKKYPEVLTLRLHDKPKVVDEETDDLRIQRLHDRALLRRNFGIPEPGALFEAFPIEYLDMLVCGSPTPAFASTTACNMTLFNSRWVIRMFRRYFKNQCGYAFDKNVQTKYNAVNVSCAPEAVRKKFQNSSLFQDMQRRGGLLSSPGDKKYMSNLDTKMDQREEIIKELMSKHKVMHIRDIMQRIRDSEATKNKTFGVMCFRTLKRLLKSLSNICEEIAIESYEDPTGLEEGAMLVVNTVNKPSETEKYEAVVEYRMRKQPPFNSDDAEFINDEDDHDSDKDGDDEESDDGEEIPIVESVRIKTRAAFDRLIQRKNAGEDIFADDDEKSSVGSVASDEEDLKREIPELELEGDSDEVLLNTKGINAFFEPYLMRRVILYHKHLLATVGVGNTFASTDIEKMLVRTFLSFVKISPSTKTLAQIGEIKDAVLNGLKVTELTFPLPAGKKYGEVLGVLQNLGIVTLYRGDEHMDDNTRRQFLFKLEGQAPSQADKSMTMPIDSESGIDSYYSWLRAFVEESHAQDSTGWRSPKNWARKVRKKVVAAKRRNAYRGIGGVYAEGAKRRKKGADGMFVHSAPKTEPPSTTSVDKSRSMRRTRAQRLEWPKATRLDAIKAYFSTFSFSNVKEALATNRPTISDCEHVIEAALDTSAGRWQVSIPSDTLFAEIDGFEYWNHILRDRIRHVLIAKICLNHVPLEMVCELNRIANFFPRDDIIFVLDQAHHEEWVLNQIGDDEMLGDFFVRCSIKKFQRVFEEEVLGKLQYHHNAWIPRNYMFPDGDKGVSELRDGSSTTLQGEMTGKTVVHLASSVTSKRIKLRVDYEQGDRQLEVINEFEKRSGRAPRLPVSDLANSEAMYSIQLEEGTGNLNAENDMIVEGTIKEFVDLKERLKEARDVGLRVDALTEQEQIALGTLETSGDVCIVPCYNHHRAVWKEFSRKYFMHTPKHDRHFIPRKWMDFHGQENYTLLASLEQALLVTVLNKPGSTSMSLSKIFYPFLDPIDIEDLLNPYCSSPPRFSREGKNIKKLRRTKTAGVVTYSPNLAVIGETYFQGMNFLTKEKTQESS
mmetsp:Transcript_32725/g.52205  ORF Transcript_32725/g.52205 Transcript_32725/m.52205 type:complete len:1366 (+) Transcript_32725:109-4206(+)|eukprot:CAMPEP_0203752962 /NCGR_PEP_ID=MMETSP0098-20131031/6816_1 /ASSEMBLY_ACC=CAM_ASM_000208 /TAXON_ID=96639 /ORGANISM=" , Strain NY0313808BC1" /LENGTH=1365 /DNA_ID=CAMNT_0050643371 /DNA_START=58 /DNA_END=4155 /DNA_ORIENTATION=-